MTNNNNGAGGMPKGIPALGVNPTQPTPSIGESGESKVARPDMGNMNTLVPPKPPAGLAEALAAPGLATFNKMDNNSEIKQVQQNPNNTNNSSINSNSNMNSNVNQSQGLAGSFTYFKDAWQPNNNYNYQIIGGPQNII